MKLPTTRQGCIEKYNLRRQMYIPLTKFDMYLGGMICCSEEEFLYRKPTPSGGVICGSPCMCNRADVGCNVYCADATDATLRMPWDAPLYEMKERYND